MRDLAKRRQERGWTSPGEDRSFERYDDDRLMACLRDNAPKARTSAAKILGRRRCVDAVGPLCRALKIEKKLYSRLAFCEALGAMGAPAVQPLVDLLGEIGRNQETTLP
ncbi:MAG: HEAT repeat domain-containing protein, partial [Desulfobacterales bacterium]|nr:HEAT repeat domain-containing protein [Desulfobacterales bacterium]